MTGISFPLGTNDNADGVWQICDGHGETFGYNGNTKGGVASEDE
jgi:hypothetical protein